MIDVPIKFLLVDDIPENLVALEALLRRDGLEILQARSGGEALELLLVHEVALAFVDVQMPGMDGFELAELMRGTARTRHVPIIFVTAGARDPKRVFAGYETGVIDFLFKPIEPHVLNSKAEVFFQLARQRQELARSLRLSETFVGILGHDLRSPLGAISMSAQLLEQTSSEPAVLRSVQRITRAADRMSEMIEQMLDLTRARLADGDGFARSSVAVDLVELVRRTVDELQAAAPGRPIEVAATGDCVTAGDPARLAQLFSNLVSNAVSHGVADGVIVVEIDGSPHALSVRVQNGGVIPSDVLPTIFDPFKRRRGGARSTGLGLGLFIARQIAVAHGGDVGVVSDAEAGTVFTVRLPRSSVLDASDPGSRRTDEGQARHLLLVDDEDGLRETLREVFEEHGYRVTTARNGREALDAMAGPTPDAVILDLAMPVMDGHSVYLAMQADPRLAHIPVLVSTSHPRRAPSGVSVLSKPARLDQWLGAVASLF